MCWWEVSEDLKVGNYPDFRTMALGLRGTEPIPRKVRDWLANYLESDFARRPRRGAPVRHSALMRKFLGDYPNSAA